MLSTPTSFGTTENFINLHVNQIVMNSMQMKDYAQNAGMNITNKQC